MGGRGPEPRKRRRRASGRSVAAASRWTGDRRAAPDVRPRLAMDPERLCAVSGLSPARRGARRVQRQVHGEPAGAARQLLRDACRSYARHLSQLLLSPPALAVRGPASRRGDLLMLNPRSKRPPGIARAEEDDFATAVLDGLSRPRQTLP